MSHLGAIAVALATIVAVATAAFYDTYTGNEISPAKYSDYRRLNLVPICAIEVKECDPKEPRRFDNSCNNLHYPSRGATFTPYRRMLPPEYGANYSLRPSSSGQPLPNARRIRTGIMSDGRVPSDKYTSMVTNAVVFITGDITSVHDTVNYVVVTRTCCQTGETNPRCIPVRVPDDDIHLRQSNVRCMNLTRAVTYQNLGCAPATLPPARINTSPPMLELSTIYGNEELSGRKSREGRGGRLRVEMVNGREWPPGGSIYCIQNEPPSETRCHDTPVAGSNMIIGGNVMAIWMYRRHNMIARTLEQLNPCWDDERIYRETREIQIGMMNQIWYYELMPALLDTMHLTKLKNHQYFLISQTKMTSKRKYLASILTIVAILESVKCLPRIDPLVQTKVGLIRGIKASDGDYSMFLGIPYAKVEEDNPFGPSIPHPQFEEVFDAYDGSTACAQRSSIGAIDCLNLNIYVPDAASFRNRLPVLVFIHGGSFTTGNSTISLYGPKFLVKHDVVLVTLNYRLDTYGFMCLDNPRVPGNQGLKDQLGALRWIKENIDSFGGDINKITISGESAGSASVDLHLLSEQELLFNQVILQSGTALSSWVMTEPDYNAPLKLSAHLGFETNDIDEALSFLSTVDSKLVTAANEDIGIKFLPCIEREFENVERFIGEDPINVAAPKARNMPILIGANNNEMIYIFANTDLETIGNVFNERLVDVFEFENDNHIKMESIVRHFYIGDDDITNDVKQSIMDFESDFNYHHPIERSVKNYVKSGANRIFRYVFSYDGGRNYLKDLYNGGDFKGASHADELGYLFDMSSMTGDTTAEDQLMIDRITTLWTNFVKYGDPTPETSDLLPVKWLPIAEDKVPYINLDSELSLNSRPFKERIAFWELFYDTNGKFQKGYKEN